MVRISSGDPTPVYTPHESATTLTTPDPNLYRPSICLFQPTDCNPFPSIQSGEQAATGIALLLINSAPRRVIFPKYWAVSTPETNPV